MRLISSFFTRTGKRLRCLILLALVIAEGWLVVGVRVGKEPSIVREYVVESEKIETPVRIVMLSDLHGCEHPTLVAQVEELDPDLILFVGDMINRIHKTGEDILVTAALTRELCELAPVYYALGNHEIERVDSHDHDALDLILEAGAILLEQSFTDLNIRGNELRLGGLYTTADVVFAEEGKNTQKEFLLDFCDTDSYRILMEHRPASYWDILYVIGYEPDLVVSGHLHGGHVILPIIGPVFGANSGLFPKYSLGRYELGASTFIVSAGLSTERHIVPRINNPTEITYIVLE